jgi:hypothetical protein
MGRAFLAGCLFMLGGIIIAVVLYTRLEGWENFLCFPLDGLQESTRWVLLIIGSGYFCWLLGAVLIRKQ